MGTGTKRRSNAKPKPKPKPNAKPNAKRGPVVRPSAPAANLAFGDSMARDDAWYERHDRSAHHLSGEVERRVFAFDKTPKPAVQATRVCEHCNEADTDPYAGGGAFCKPCARTLGV